MSAASGQGRILPPLNAEGVRDFMPFALRLLEQVEETNILPDARLNKLV